jgi:hypothetical protein
MYQVDSYSDHIPTPPYIECTEVDSKITQNLSNTGKTTYPANLGTSLLGMSSLTQPPFKGLHNPHVNSGRSHIYYDIGP